MEKCYSRNEEEYNFTCPEDVFDDMYDDGDFEVGALYYEADAEKELPSYFFDMEWMLENMSERAYDVGSEYAEDFPDLSKEKSEELELIIKNFLDANCNVNFWTVRNSKGVRVTQEEYDKFMKDK